MSWETAEFETMNMTTEEVDFDSICSPESPGDTIFPEKRNFTESKALCKSMGGKMTVISSAKQQKTLDHMLMQQPTCFSGSKTDLEEFIERLNKLHIRFQQTWNTDTGTVGTISRPRGSTPVPTLANFWHPTPSNPGRLASPMVAPWRTAA